MFVVHVEHGWKTPSRVQANANAVGANTAKVAWETPDGVVDGGESGKDTDSPWKNLRPAQHGSQQVVTSLVVMENPPHMEW